MQYLVIEVSNFVSLISLISLVYIMFNFKFSLSNVFISRRALAREGDYNLHHVCAYVRACVCHAVFSETTTVTHFW